MDNQSQNQSQQQTLETDQQQYQQRLHALSQAIHPFEITTSESQFAGSWQTFPSLLESNPRTFTVCRSRHSPRNP
ncbi:MAG: hypothetical protein ACO3NK_04150, partial [Prochlorotrichaceae cyanobacterium]